MNLFYDFYKNYEKIDFVFHNIFLYLFHINIFTIKFFRLYFRSIKIRYY